jgi:hypothetical protein
MSHELTDAELESKSIAELEAMLADDDLLPLDDETNTDYILRITGVIIKKENKPAEQIEAENIVFWTKFLERYGDEIPILLEDVLHTEPVRKPRKMPLRKLGIAAAAIAALFICNSVVALAFNVNVLRTVVSFTDELFTKKIVPEQTLVPDEPNKGADSYIGEYASLQDTLDANGITQPKAPMWLPEGYVYSGVEINVSDDRIMVAGIYDSTDDNLAFIITSYANPPEQLAYYEKNEGVPDIYERNGIEHYIFKNMDRTVATWFIGTSDCAIQGNISNEEMISIINSLYEV